MRTRQQHSERVITPTIARRLAITKQRLAGPRPAAGATGIVEVAQDLGSVQMDPINVVARTQLLVLRSRVPKVTAADLAQVTYKDRQLFEYWAHCASLVPTADYPIHEWHMHDLVHGTSAWGKRVQEWATTNRSLADYILDRLRQDGPLPLTAFEDRTVSGWTSAGWTSGRNVARMLDHLWLTGEVMVSGRNGIQRRWDLTERVLPDWAPRESWPTEQVVQTAAQRAIKALGVARTNQITQHFTRWRYPGLKDALAAMVANQTLVPVTIAGEEAENAPKAWAGPWYLHADDLPLLDELVATRDGADWAPRTNLLSPFDNLICDRKRTQLLFNFDFTIEIYVPKVKRRWGYYVLPILHGDRLIGRIDPVMDRSKGQLTIQAIYAEPDAPVGVRVGRAIGKAIAELASFLDAREISYVNDPPAIWAKGIAG